MRSQSSRPIRCRSAPGLPVVGHGGRAAQRAPIACGSFANTVDGFDIRKMAELKPKLSANSNSKSKSITVVADMYMYRYTYIHIYILMYVYIAAGCGGADEKVANCQRNFASRPQQSKATRFNPLMRPRT